MKTLYIGDPFPRLKPATDSSLALVREDLKRKNKVFWAEPSALRLEQGKLWVSAMPCVQCDEGMTPEVGTNQEKALRDFNVVWIRKDPPFDSEYTSLCWLLALEEKSVLMVNRPSLLLRYHEKLLPFEAHAQGFLSAKDLIPTHVGSAGTARDFLKRGGIDWAIRKPFFGFGGADIKRFQVGDSKRLPNEDELELTQPYLEEISTLGDRRVFFLAGRYIGDFVRLPQAGEVVSNIARGGRAAVLPLTAKQKTVVDRLGKFLKKVGIVFAGADMIGSRVSEVNVTSPTGLLSYRQLTGIDLVPRILDYIERSAL